MHRTRLATSLPALAIATVLAAGMTGCGQSASTASTTNSVDPATATLPPPAAEMPASPNLPTAPSVPGNPAAPADPGTAASVPVTPPDTDAAYNRGAGNANVGPGNDGSAGTQPSGSNSETNATRRDPPPR